jgi:hypothetical protein
VEDVPVLRVLLALRAPPIARFFINPITINPRIPARVYNHENKNSLKLRKSEFNLNDENEILP